MPAHFCTPPNVVTGFTLLRELIYEFGKTYVKTARFPWSYAEREQVAHYIVTRCKNTDTRWTPSAERVARRMFGVEL